MEFLFSPQVLKNPLETNFFILKSAKDKWQGPSLCILMATRGEQLSPADRTGRRYALDFQAGSPHLCPHLCPPTWTRTCKTDQLESRKWNSRQTPGWPSRGQKPGLVQKQLLCQLLCHQQPFHTPPGSFSDRFPVSVPWGVNQAAMGGCRAVGKPSHHSVQKAFQRPTLPYGQWGKKKHAKGWRKWVDSSKL